MKFRNIAPTAIQAHRARQREERAGFRRRALACYVVKAANKKKATRIIEGAYHRKRELRAAKRLDNYSIRTRTMIDIGTVLKVKGVEQYQREMAAQLDAKSVIVRYAGPVGDKAGEKLKRQNHIVIFDVWRWRNKSHPTKDRVMPLFNAYLDKYITVGYLPKDAEEVEASSRITKFLKPRAKQMVTNKKIINDWFFGENPFCPTCHVLYDDEERCGNCCTECHKAFEDDEGEETGYLCGGCLYEEEYLDAVDYCSGCGYYTGAVCGCP